MHTLTTLTAGLTFASALRGRIDNEAEAYGVDVGMSFGKRWAFEVGAYGYGGFDAPGTPCASGIETSLEGPDAKSQDRGAE